MKALLNLFGALLIVAGVAGFVYPKYTYTEDKEIVKVGDVKVTAPEDKAIHISPVLSGLLLVLGAGIIAFGIIRRK